MQPGSIFIKNFKLLRRPIRHQKNVRQWLETLSFPSWTWILLPITDTLPRYYERSPLCQLNWYFLLYLFPNLASLFGFWCDYSSPLASGTSGSSVCWWCGCWSILNVDSWVLCTFFFFLICTFEISYCSLDSHCSLLLFLLCTRYKFYHTHCHSITYHPAWQSLPNERTQFRTQLLCPVIP